MPLRIAWPHCPGERDSHARLLEFAGFEAPLPMTSLVRALLIGMLLATIVPSVLAQSPSETASDLTPDQRRAYNDGLAEARKLIADKQWGRAGARLDTLIKERP